MKKEEKEIMLLEERKVKALEKIATTLDALTVWVEEIDKKEWSERIQYYLSEFYKVALLESLEISEKTKKIVTKKDDKK